MKKMLMSIFIVVLLSLSSFCQDESMRSTIKRLMPETYSVIAKRASNEWPTDFEMQKYVIEKQCVAFREYLRIEKLNPIPHEVYSTIENGALKEWCKNDWVICIKEINTKGNDGYYSCLNADWEMIVYTINKQIEAYKDLQ